MTTQNANSIKPSTPYVYMIVWRDPMDGEIDKAYIGMRYATGCRPDELFEEDGYFTSSTVVKEYTKYNGNPDEGFILKTFDTCYNLEDKSIEAKKCHHLEKSLLSYFDVKCNQRFLNKSVVGCGIISEESRLRMRESGKGRKHLEKTKKKISESNKGKVVSPETREKISKSLKGRRVSPETEFTRETSRRLALERSKKDMLPSQINAKNGSHHWYSKEHSRMVSEKNKIKFKGTITVTDKEGKSKRISKEEFEAQKIVSIVNWKYVGVSSKEAKHRRSK